jgi:uncharacterized protein
MIYVFNATKGITVAAHAEAARSPLARAIGLLGRAATWNRFGNGLWISPCRGVHTMGMAFPIDLLYLDAQLRVLGINERVQPWRRPPAPAGTASVLELPSGTCWRTNTAVGDRLSISQQEAA